jgi:hypothetical protein
MIRSDRPVRRLAATAGLEAGRHRALARTSAAARRFGWFLLTIMLLCVGARDARAFASARASRSASLESAAAAPGARAAGGAQAAGIARELVEAAGRALSRRGLSAGSREAAEAGLEAAAERLAPRLVAEGGAALAQRAVSLADELGPAWIEVLESSALRAPLIEALEKLPAATRPGAVSALLREGPALQRAVARLGSEALEVELRHPGIGAGFVEAVGPRGVPLARSLASEDLAILARYQREIAGLPAAQADQLFAALGRNARGICEYLRRNPGFALGAGTLALLLSESERAVEILAESADRVGEIAAASADRLTRWIAPVLALALGAWLALKVWNSNARRSASGRSGG